MNLQTEWELPAESQDPQKSLKKQWKINDFTDLRGMSLMEIS